MPTAPGIASAFDDVGKTFPDGTEVLRGVSLTAADGGFVSLVGPSGAGKATLSRIAPGLTAPSGAQVGYPRPADPRLDAAVGDVAQTVPAALPESFT